MRHNRSFTRLFTFAAALAAVIFATSLVPSVAHAAETAGETIKEAAPDLSWQQALIPILTPLIIAGVKLVVPAIPRVWLPVLAPVLGVALDLISGWATGATTNAWLALALGAAGVGVRETINQAKKSIDAALPPGVDPTW